MGQNGMPFAPMLEAAMRHQSVEDMVKDHLMQIIGIMGQRYSVSLILDDLVDPNNCGVLSGPGAAPWRTVVASINAAIQTGVPLPEHDRTQIAKTLGLQAAAVVTAGEKADFLFGEVDRLKLTLMRLRSFCDDGGKEIIKKALGGETDPNAADTHTLEDRIALAKSFCYGPVAEQHLTPEYVAQTNGMRAAIHIIEGGTNEELDALLLRVPSDSAKD